jgi:hypothetical protein
MRNMATWRCPHCGTPQAETAACWVCRRPTTTCATCRNFRTAVVARVGYCGLDRSRQPLSGDERRACWSGALATVARPAARSRRDRGGELVTAGSVDLGLWADADA